MNSRTIVIGVVISMIICCSALADRQLSRTEITQLFQELTSNPKTTWIEAGTIEAAKEEYRAPKTIDEQQILDAINQNIEDYQNNDQKAERTEQLQKMALDAIPFNVRYHLSNEYTMKTTTTLKCDGQKYYCDITVDSRKDSVELPEELKNNFSTDEFNLDWNSRRISCFDGEKFTIYTPQVNHAMVDAAGSFPTGSLEPLSSGIIPWGYRYFTYENLTQIESSAIEKSVDGHSRIHLSLTNSDGSELLIVLDTEKAYAPLSWVINTADYSIAHQYGGYKLVSGSWVPASIIIEKFDTATNKLISSDHITITNINGEIPSAGSFSVDFNPNTLIEYTYDKTKPQLIYYYSNTANTELLLAERKAYMVSEGQHLQNCATAALQYAALLLGKDILNQQLSQLVNPDDNKTSMHDMKKYAENEGFYCKAVKTDIQTLKNLSACKAILHIPGKNHFVLLDNIDQKYVWIIDLSKDKFYYRADINFFGMDWTEGTALLISNQPISLPAETTEITDDQLISYVGGSGYLCNIKLQDHLIRYCEMVGVDCFGIYQMIFTRWGCGVAESGSCSETVFMKKVTWPCIDDLYYPYMCDLLISGLHIYYMLACE